MRRGKPAVLCMGVLLLLMAGCYGRPDANKTTDSDVSATDQIIESMEPTTEPTPRPAPTETEVLEMREQVLQGMSEEEIQRLTNIITQSNRWWEGEYFYSNIFEQLSDPQSPTWNYFQETGDIDIGWAYDGSLDKDAICAEEGLTEWEFYEKYGTGVSTYNEYDADGFIALLQETSASVQKQGFKQDLQYIMDQTRLAKETHDMEHANNLYKALHDMDYFLLRYGPKDVGPYVSDTSTVTKYYGMLSVYADS